MEEATGYMRVIAQTYLNTFFFIAFLLAIGTVAAAFTAPSSVPPAENIDTPLTGSGTNQEKVGGLWLNSQGNPSDSALIVEYGDVGIGIADPQEQLHVQENLRTDGCLSANEGKVGECADLAEIYRSSEQLTAGELVVALEGRSVGRAVKERQPALLGVVSTNPALILEGQASVFGSMGGMGKDNQVPVALLGRVPVRVTAENGSIHPGDPISISRHIPGAGAKAVQSGRIAGIALESYESQEPTALGTVLLFVNPHYWQEDSRAVEDKGTGETYCLRSEGGIWKELEDPCI